MTNITMACVDLAVHYRIQPRYGATLARMDEMRVEEEEEGEVLVARERRGAIGECLVGNYGCQDGWLSEQCP